MSTVLDFTTAARPRRRLRRAEDYRLESGEVVLFPGIRIERHDVDLSYRVKDSYGEGGPPEGRKPRRPS